MAADGYQLAWLAAERAGGRAHMLARLADLKQRHAIHAQAVLELGSGLGANLALLATDNRVQGVEALTAAAQQAGAAGIPTHVADLADLARYPLPWPDASWDWVLLLDVLEHLVDPALALHEARRLLRPGGHLVVNLPNHFDWRGRWRLVCGSGIDSGRWFVGQPAWRYPHLRFFRHADALGLLTHTGFRLVDDLSAQQPSVPWASAWPRLAARCAGRWPDLAASGFLLVARVDEQTVPGPDKVSSNPAAVQEIKCPDQETSAGTPKALAVSTAESRFPSSRPLFATNPRMPTITS